MYTVPSEWSKQAVGILIEAYKNKHCLYNTKSKDYHNKRQRREALKKIAEILQQIRPGTTLEDVKKKINTIRSQYLSEVNKIIKSRKSGCEIDDVYRPSLWCYNQLEFLRDIVAPRKSESNYIQKHYMEVEQSHNAQDETEYKFGDTSAGAELLIMHQDNIRDEYERPTPEELLSHSPSTSFSPPEIVNVESIRQFDPPSRKSKRRYSAEEDALALTSQAMQKLVNQLDVQDDESSLVGRLVASRLRKIKNELTRVKATDYILAYLSDLMEQEEN